MSLSGLPWCLLLLAALLVMPASSHQVAQPGLYNMLPNGTTPGDVLQRPSSNTRVNGTTPPAALPQLDVCGCPAASISDKAPGQAVVTAMQNLSASTTWQLERTIFLRGQDVFHTEVCF